MISARNTAGEVIEGASELGILLESLYQAWSADELDFGSFQLVIDNQNVGELLIRKSGIELRPEKKYCLPLREGLTDEF